MADLHRLLRPRSVAVIGGGAWCANVIEQCARIGFPGEIWPVHPRKSEVGGLPAFASLSDLPTAPDAAFIGVNRDATIEVVRELAAMDAGGAVCFASGFSEAQEEMADGVEKQEALLAAAGEMKILGPNCYGMLNYLDGAALWPDQHGGVASETGVALITQSSNIAINLTMQARGLPLAYVVTAGNQAQTGLSEIGKALLQDERVTALGLHIEGIDDLRGFEAMAAEAARLGKSVVAVKIGKSDHAQSAAISHTASLAGSDAGARALLKRLNIGQVSSLSTLLEILKLLHVAGPLTSNRIASMSCSGGEASLMADTAHDTGLTFPPLNTRQETDLRAALGHKVALANPLDYHTYIWGDRAALTKCFTAMMDPDLAMGVIVVDFPRADRCSAAEWEDVIVAASEAQKASDRPVALLSSLPENIPEDISARLITMGVVPLAGMTEAIEAMDVAARIGTHKSEKQSLFLPKSPETVSVTLSEAEGKSLLAGHGLRIPGAARAASPEAAATAAERIGYPVVLKGEGIAHKSDAGAVALNLTDAQSVSNAAKNMPCDRFLVEEMITGTVAELLVGVVRDPAHGMVLTLAAGGVLTEMLQDSTSLLVPASRDDVLEALNSLKIAKLLNGYRGQPAANKDAIADAVMAVQAAVMAEAPEEIEINPLMCGPDVAIAADALIRTGGKS
ncbi:acetate--CoA ligase family protein [Thalassobius sp. I31.1]|uniref:acetate--CoA ligase family protein n=1 Tax=Thalassobius sp. I31.1 TaxID=2109912 RepID=UPI000D1B156B|nr:acetate--CoA ligase family protein [Thalassobius sp. I31.1]